MHHAAMGETRDLESRLTDMKATSALRAAAFAWTLPQRREAVQRGGG